MNVRPTAIPDVLVLEPRVFRDARGFFVETWNDRVFREATGVTEAFVQDNQSRSSRGVLRGLHYQVERPQGKVVRVVRGAVFDVAVDLRQSSPTFGQWVGEELSADNGLQMWIPAGFAHGFLVLSDEADTLYKSTDYYSPASERTLLWNDPALGIAWPAVNGAPPVLSERDQLGTPWHDCDKYL